MRYFALTAALVAALPAFAQQPPRQPDPVTVQMQLEETQFLLAQRRDQVAKAEKAIEDGDARLKWVLDNWVRKAK